MKVRWEIRDLIDLEYLLHRDNGTEAGAPQADDAVSDREIYLEYAKIHQPPFSRRALIKHWLDRRRAIETDRNGPGVLPGSAVSETLRLIRLSIIIVGCIFGASLSWTLLTYKGVSPINIFTCLWVLIVPQILLLLTLLILILYHRFYPNPTATAGYPLLTGLIRRLMIRLKHSADSRLSAGNRSRMQSAIGQIGRHKSIYGGVFFWPIFILAQTFGTCFNAGALAAAFIRISITDLAFGWQSTLQPAPATVYKIIEAISAPWSWLVPATAAHPTIAQIEGSKMVLKNGIYHLATRNLVSWWPFLCLAILFYGFLPRLLLLALGYLRQRLALSRLTLSHAACDRLVSRMETPTIATVSREYSSAPAESKLDKTEAEKIAKSVQADFDTGTSAIAVISEELLQACTPEAVEERTAKILGYAVAARMTSTGDPESDAGRLRGIYRSLPADTASSCRIILLVEAWQPPIKEILSWITALRGAVGGTTGMVVALTGRPQEEAPLTPAADMDYMIWKQTIARLGDPYLRVERF